MIVYFHKLYLFSLQLSLFVRRVYYNIPSIECLYVYHVQKGKNPVVDILLERVIDIIKRYRWPIYKKKKKG